MHIHLFHHSKIEGEALRLLLMKKGHQVVFNPGDNFLQITSDLHEEGLWLLDINSLSKCELSQLQLSKNTIVFIGYLKDIHWFFKICETSRGFICKDEKLNELLTGIKKLRANKIFLSSKTSDFLNKSKIKRQQILLRRNLKQHLTDTELRIMQETSQGKTAKIIAREWHRSIHTIYNHRKNIMRKLNLEGKIRLNKFCYKKDSSIQSLISLNKNEMFFKSIK